MMYVHVIGTCRKTGVPEISRKVMTAPDWKLYCDNAKYRHDNPNWNQTIKAGVNQRHNASKTQINGGEE